MLGGDTQYRTLITGVSGQGGWYRAKGPMEQGCLIQDRPDDYVVATGEARSVRDFVAAAFAAVGEPDWESHVDIDPGLYRPADPRALVGDPSRLRSLGWRPRVGFEELVSIMVHADLAELDRRTPATDPQ